MVKMLYSVQAWENPRGSDPRQKRRERGTLLTFHYSFRQRQSLLHPRECAEKGSGLGRDGTDQRHEMPGPGWERE